MPYARWQATITDDRGNIVDAPQIRVQREQAGFPLARLYSDRDGTTPLANPFALASGESLAAFHVAGGAYKITATKGAFSRVWRYVAIGLGAESDTPPFVTGGTWSGGSPPTEYEQNVIVSHDGASYFSIQPHSGIEPGVDPGWEDYWQLISERGEQGIQGEQGDQGPTGPEGPSGGTGIAAAMAIVFG
ncbi:protein of unknown function [Hyphomicrobium sp. 1Nfss2.1]|uniref:hypothetical protein n=1 Tax=Hyphomicrobium sp. 1Nfss2.1 TaxID=3413936 RepID=UPI003C7B2C9D